MYYEEASKGGFSGLGPIGPTLDLAGGQMYWTDTGAGDIQRANLLTAEDRELHERYQRDVMRR